MWKWVLIFIAGIAALTIYLQRQVGDATPAVATAAPAVRTASLAVASTAPAPNAAEGNAAGVGRLSVSQEHLMNRVPLRKLAPIKEEILPQ